MVTRSFYPGDKVRLIKEMKVAVEGDLTYAVQTTDVGTIVEINPRTPQHVSCGVVAIRFSFSRLRFIFVADEIVHVD